MILRIFIVAITLTTAVIFFLDYLWHVPSRLSAVVWPLLYLAATEILAYHKRKTKELLNQIYGRWTMSRSESTGDD